MRVLTVNNFKGFEFRSFFLTTLFVLSLNFLFAQKAKITESVELVKTYAFGEPNPLPILKENAKIYPYYKFEGYDHEAKDKEWKVVTLENDYIKLWVLPEVGGKVWGAVEKATGEEFIYKNEVLKFRNIAMRGPWTSGGIEFNFGIIGHTPATATPVDYLIRENNDGSVSCIVGNMDLPSRTKWWVEINLQKDKAYFETKASWYNPTSLNQSYYNWMTAAAAASNDLEFFIPGNQYLEHGGNAKLWPVDEQGRTISVYKNNNFGPHKSYHVVGDYKDFFGGYYHNKNFGFGHWSLYEDMPGQKLWLWALSRSGGIWEDLLTDTDGQYIEFQAGRLFNQYAPSEQINPITQANFEPHAMDSWREIWFPFKAIDGMVEATEYGVLNVDYKGDETVIGFNALQTINERIKVSVNGEEAIDVSLQMKPMDVFIKTIPSNENDTIQVVVGNKKLKYTTNISESLIKRPFYSDTTIQVSKIQKLYTKGWEAMKYRVFDVAYNNFSELIKIDPSHTEAWVKLAELEYRKTNYDKALECVNHVLRTDTYHPEANYKAGIIYRAKKDYVNALESLGWAARSMQYRSVSYAQMAEIYLLLQNKERAKAYALRSLDFNTYNLNARKVLLVLARKENHREDFKKHLDQILNIAPLDYLASFEAAKMDIALKNKPSFQNEFTHETALELAMEYQNIGLTDEAVDVLKATTSNVKSKIWLAYLLQAEDDKLSLQLLKQAIAMPVDFVSPYRIETVPVLNWASESQPHWKLNFYLAQNYIAIGKENEGKALLKNYQYEPDSDTFYRFRASYLENEDFAYRLEDFKKALELNVNNWKIWEEIIQFYLKNKKYSEAYLSGLDAFKKFPKNHNIALLYAKTLVEVKKYSQSINVLKDVIVLPSELAMTSRNIYFDAHVFLANEFIQKRKYDKAIQLLNDSKKWPEHLGVGKPYAVDNRVQDYLLAMCYDRLNKADKKQLLLEDVARYTLTNKGHYINDLFGALALKKLERKDDLNKLLSKLKDKDKTNLVLSFYNKDKEKLLAIKEENTIAKGLYELMENAIEY